VFQWAALTSGGPAPTVATARLVLSFALTNETAGIRFETDLATTLVSDCRLSPAPCNDFDSSRLDRR
jgi:hypothetical protein